MVALLCAVSARPKWQEAIMTSIFVIGGHSPASIVQAVDRLERVAKACGGRNSEWYVGVSYDAPAWRGTA
jgi:hypothetical protein